MTSTPVGKHRIEPLDANVSFDGSVARWVFVVLYNSTVFLFENGWSSIYCTLSARAEKEFSSWEDTKIYCVYLCYIEHDSILSMI